MYSTITQRKLPEGNSENKRFGSRWILFLRLFCCMLITFPALSQIEPTVNTNKDDYWSGEQVIITGSDWNPGEVVNLIITETTTLQKDTIITVADDNGNITSSEFVTQDNETLYSLEAKGTTTGEKDETTFTNSSGLFQAHNGGVDAPPVSPVEWVKGNAHGGNSHYLEGESVPYRIILREVGVGTHMLEIGFDIRQGGKNALDYITSNNRIAETVDPIIDVMGPFDAPTTCPVPSPQNSILVTGFEGEQLQPKYSFNQLGSEEKEFIGFNAVLDSAVYTAVGDLTADQSEARIAIYFHVVGNTKDVVISWGGHIASRLDWGGGNSASNINGSPYHMRFIQLDGQGGNQDRSLKTDAVQFKPVCDVQGPLDACGTTQIVVHSSTNAPFPKYQWMVNNGASIIGSSVADSVVIQTPSSGTFDVSLVVIDFSDQIESLPSDTCGITISVRQDPTVNAGLDDQQCHNAQGNVFNLAGTVSSGQAEWSLMYGNGFFADSSDLNTTFTAQSDSIIIRLTAKETCDEVYDDAWLKIHPVDFPTISGQGPTCDVPNALHVTDFSDLEYSFVWSIQGNAQIQGDHTNDSVVVVPNNICAVDYTLYVQCTNNSTTCVSDDSLTISFADSVPPTIFGQGNDTIISCPAIPVFTAPSASDACGQTSIIMVSDTTVAGACAGAYTRTKTWKALDACGNESQTVSQAITVIDNTAPSIFGAGADTTIACPGVPQFTAPQASDDCDPNPSIVLVSDSTVDGACAGTYVRTKTWKAVDACGNESGTVSQAITVVDNTAPSIFGAGADATIACPGVPQFTAPQASDDCDPNPAIVLVSDSTEDGACVGTYVRTKTWKAVDACGNESGTVSQAITVIDNTAPSIFGAGADATISCPGVPQFTAPQASDDCDPNPSIVLVSDSTVDGACAGTYVRTKTWKAVDACGNESGTVSQAITVVDNTAPSIFGAGADATIACPGVPQFTAPQASDDCDPNPSIVLVSDSTVDGACAGTYVRTKTWKAVDACGNESGTVSQAITVIDNTAPSIFGQGADATIACPGVPQFTAPQASDDCDPNPSIVLVSDSTVDGACAGTYVRTKTWKAVDACGNESGTVSQAITVVDNTAPSIFGAGADATIACPGVPQFTAPQASDDCDPNPSIVLVSDSTVDGACAGTYVRTKTWKAVDACGNESGTVSQAITVVDNTAPSIFGVGADATIACPGVPQFTAPQASDDCDPNPSIVLVSDSTVDGACAGTYVRTKTWKAVDACGNESGTVSQAITVIDNTAPSIFGAGADATISCPGVPQFTAPQASDDCDPNPSIVLVSDSTVDGACAGTYVRTKTWKAVDACGNESGTVSQAITVVDNTAPSIFGQGADATIACPGVPQFTAPQASDDCDPNPSIVLVSDSTVDGACAGTYVRTKTWKAVDACGNESGTVSQAITVIDNTAPSIFGQGADTTIHCYEIPHFSAPDASDECDPQPAIVVVSDTTTPGACLGSFTRTMTWKAVDACGNESNPVSQTITVIDDAPPVVDFTPSDETIFCPVEPVFTPPTGTDDCGIVTVIVVSADTLVLADGSVEFTMTWRLEDDCGNQSGLIKQTITQICAKARCSLTQGFYGNEGGVACATGEGTPELLGRLLGEDFGDLYIGRPGRSLNITNEDVYCIIEKLPAGGKPAVLPAGDNSFDPTCKTGTSFDAKTKFNNVFVGQVITLGLNLRLDEGLGAVQLESNQMMTYGTLPSTDQLCGTLDDIIVNADLVVKNIPQSVLNALDTEYEGDKSIDNLYKLANRGIGGEIIAGVSLADLNKACSAINEGFDECRYLGGFNKAMEETEEISFIDEQFQFEVFPNPFQNELNVTFVSNVDANVQIELISLNGEKIETLYADGVEAGTAQRVVFNADHLSKGMYLCRIISNGKSYITRVVMN